MDKDVVCLYSGILLSHKNEIILSVATGMDLESITLSGGQFGFHKIQRENISYLGKHLLQDARWRCKRGIEISRSFFLSLSRVEGKKAFHFHSRYLFPLTWSAAVMVDQERRICKFQCESWEICSVLPTSQEITGAFEKPRLWNGIKPPLLQ